MRWTEYETNYLIDNWGRKTLYVISKRLKRSESSVKQKAKLLGLGSWKLSSEYITINELASHFNTNTNSIAITWIQNNKLPCIKSKLSDKRYLTMIDIDKFWKWAEKHQELIKADCLEENSLGAEPKWFIEKRKADMKNPYKHFWGREKEDRLKYDLSKFCYTYDDLCKKYGVSYKTLNKKINQLGIMNRPINPNAGRSKWNDEMENKLISMIADGYSRKEIYHAMGKSKSSLETKILTLYGTSNFKTAKELILREREAKGSVV